MSDIQEFALAAIKVEAGKVLDKWKKRRKSALHVLADSEFTSGEIDRLTAQIMRLERKRISLYDEYAVGSIDRDVFLAAKAKDQTEISRAESRISELRERVSIKTVEDSRVSDESLLKRILEATEISSEILALIKRITVYDEERIEISFDFGDVNE